MFHSHEVLNKPTTQCLDAIWPYPDRPQMNTYADAGGGGGGGGIFWDRVVTKDASIDELRIFYYTESTQLA